MRSNPLLPGFHPDPSICRVGEDYYLATSTFEYFPGLPIYHSRDLSTWELVGHAAHRRDQFDLAGVKGSGGMFAPTLRHHEGRFYLVCTLMHGHAERGSFLLSTDDPAGEWSDPVWLHDAPGIDPSLFFDEDGTCWYTGCDLNPVPGSPEQTDIWLQRLDLAAGRLVGPRTVLTHGVLRGARWAEGPHLYPVDDGVLLLHAEGGTERNHAVMASRAASVHDPFVPHAGNPVLTHRHLGRGEPMYGVGHADLVTTPDGDTWAVALAMRTYDGVHHIRGRETVIVPVEWEDGWPVFAPGTGRVPDRVELPALPADSPWLAASVIDGEHAPDGRWLQLRTGAQPWRHTADGLTLRASGDALTDRGTPAYLAHRLLHEDLDIDVDVAGAPRGDGIAGLALYQSELFHVVAGIRRDEDVLALVIEEVRGGEHTRVADAVLEDTPHGTTVAVRIRGGALTALVRSSTTEVAAIVEMSTLSTEVAGGFVGTTTGPVLVSAAHDDEVLFPRVSVGPA